MPMLVTTVSETRPLRTKKFAYYHKQTTTITSFFMCICNKNLVVLFWFVLFCFEFLSGFLRASERRRASGEWRRADGVDERLSRRAVRLFMELRGFLLRGVFVAEALKIFIGPPWQTR